MIVRKKMTAEITSLLNAGGVGILPTDTLYGLVGSALLPKTVERIYRLRKRSVKKPMIVLIGSLDDLRIFGAKVSKKEENFLIKHWPEKLSMVLRVPAKKYFHLQRGTKTIAFRLPKPAWLRRLLKTIGPLVAPSANFEGEKPALTIKDAKKYFMDKVDFYMDNGRMENAPSALIKFKSGKPLVLRQGAIKLD